MTMIRDEIDGALLKKMIFAGAESVEREKEGIDFLNVFPVPDRDTGANMSMTLASAVREISETDRIDVRSVARALSSGAEKGAHGNSGVILSQIFRGMAQVLADSEAVTASCFALSLETGVASAYKTMAKPMEGTILTVAKEAAKKAAVLAKSGASLQEVFEGVCFAAETALTNTPEQLPELRRAGVVDAGGKGLTLIYRGFLMALTGRNDEDLPQLPQSEMLSEAGGLQKEKRQPATNDVGDILFRYCAEYTIRCLAASAGDIQTERLRAELECIGDSIALFANESMIKVHVHTDKPDRALACGLELGELDQIKIENMRLQIMHRS
jgi:DAK2 domain fusion protein YloV